MGAVVGLGGASGPGTAATTLPAWADALAWSRATRYGRELEVVVRVELRVLVVEVVTLFLLLLDSLLSPASSLSSLLLFSLLSVTGT